MSQSPPLGSSVLARLRGKLIVSVQFPRGSPLARPENVAAMAAAAVEAGAAGVRIESAAHLQAVRARVDVPVIGILKREYDGFLPYITPTLGDVREVLAAGAEIVAFDATRRPRPDGSTTAAIVDHIRRAGALAMADCALGEDGRDARDAGAEVLATTLCGYTETTRGAALPALQLVGELATFDAFTVCEGGIADPESACAALESGADAVVVGTAIAGTARDAETIFERTRAFVAALRTAREGSARVCAKPFWRGDE
ncbi:MAG TPA: putative N-acetylmannosamine-6-phosphate 2-epimerase [Candidatus Dormibacteraeota bacterium]|nr:putative N-acetylmannosamine-6-phosphate 2-epimerase [Candidatus Dormibacteraeota bacterium]